MSLPAGLISFGPDANCTLELCPLEASILEYRPSTPASSVSLAIFGLSLLVNIVQGIYYRTWGFAASLICGCILEIVGYAGRVILNSNPFDFTGFVMQIVCITVAPVFFCGAIYVLLSKTISRIDERVSRFNPRLFSWIFIPCDIVSLILQAVGGGLSCVGSTEADIQVGVNVSLAGLIFQVVTLSVFTGLFVDYLLLSRFSFGRAVFTRRMTIFLLFMFMAVILMLIRCVYRVVELREGYFSELFRDEPLFIALETGIMCAAVICMNIGHPGLVFGKGNGKTDLQDSLLEL